MESILFSIGIALAVGLIMSRIVKMLKLPAVTRYLVGGILIGPYCLGRLGIDGIGFNNMDEVHNLKVLSEIALGFIAFSIGNEFRISQLRKTGKTALIIGIVQALAATLVVDVGLYLLHLVFRDKLPITAVITLGAIAAATAPAARLDCKTELLIKNSGTALAVKLTEAVAIPAFSALSPAAMAVFFKIYKVNYIL